MTYPWFKSIRGVCAEKRIRKVMVAFAKSLTLCCACAALASPAFGKTIRSLKEVGRQYNREYTLIENDIVLVGGVEWRVEECEGRIALWSRDGDARIIVGMYHLLNEDYEKAAEVFEKAEFAKYTVFSDEDLRNGLGQAYYEMGKTVKRDSPDGYIELLEKEKTTYKAAYGYGSPLDRYFFQYNCAAVWIDLGMWLEGNARRTLKMSHGDTVEGSIILPGTRTSINAEKAFQRAAVILTKVIQEKAYLGLEVFQGLALVYRKLGSPENAERTRMLEVNAREEVTVARRNAELLRAARNFIRAAPSIPEWAHKEYSAISQALFMEDTVGVGEKTNDLIYRIVGTAFDQGTTASETPEVNVDSLTRVTVRSLGHKIQNRLDRIHVQYILTRIERKLQDGRHEAAFEALTANRAFIIAHDRALYETWYERIDAEQTALVNKRVAAAQSPKPIPPSGKAPEKPRPVPAPEPESEPETRVTPAEESKPRRKAPGPSHSVTVIKPDAAIEITPLVGCSDPIAEGAMNTIRELIGRQEYKSALNGIRAYKGKFVDCYGKSWVQMIDKGSTNPIDGVAGTKELRQFEKSVLEISRQ